MTVYSKIYAGRPEAKENNETETGLDLLMIITMLLLMIMMMMVVMVVAVVVFTKIEKLKRRIVIK